MKADLPDNLPLNHAETIAVLIRECAAPGFYGDLVLTFQAGALVLTRITRTAKPPHPVRSRYAEAVPRG